ncbi:MAG: hypothetical protein Q4E02_02180 [Lagierella massiliensis]|nr:hypothetical protein [Lagierella massiliensis]
MTHIPFSECINIYAYENVIDFDYYFNIFKPDIVIFEGAEYATTSNYFNVDRLGKKTLNPILDENKAKKVNVNPKVVIKDNICSITVEMQRQKYAYIKIEDEVFDLLWDEEKKLYYCDIDKDSYNEKISVLVFPE